jgi:hypothetical protein
MVHQNWHRISFTGKKNKADGKIFGVGSILFQLPQKWTKIDSRIERAGLH